jgi:lactate permease
MMIPHALFSPPPKEWLQHYDPTGHWWLSSGLAALPLGVLLICMIGFRVKGHLSALLATGLALAVSVVAFHMPLSLAVRATGLGAAYGLFPIFWIVFPVIFLYQLTVRAGRFALLQDCFVGITEDSRLQLILVAFILGSFFEGVAGFGSPVAICSTILIGLGFRPMKAAGLALVANTAPVAFGSLGIPIVALHGVTGLDLYLLSRVVAMLLVPFCLLLPFWLIWMFAGFRAMREIWPAALVAGCAFASSQLIVAWFSGPWLVDIAAAIFSLSVLVVFLVFWKPKRILDADLVDMTDSPRSLRSADTGTIMRASTPWLILTVLVVLWGMPHFVAWLDSMSAMQFRVPLLDGVISRTPPVVYTAKPEPAVFLFNWLSATGTGIFLSGLVAALAMRLPGIEIARVFWRTVVTTRYTALTIAALTGMAFLSKFCGLDATLGLALARTDLLYPFFGTWIGWLGTASTGSDTSSNVLFGNLQVFTSQRLGVSPYLMASANSAGGVMGKMIAPQSVVIASTATGVYGSEGIILRFVILQSIGFVGVMALLVSLLAHAPAVSHWLVP